MSRRFTGIVCLLVLGGLALLVCRDQTLTRLQRRLGHRPLPVELSDSYREHVDWHLRRDAQLPPGSVLIIGDSHVQGLAVTAVAPLAVNLGIGNDTTVGVLDRLPRYTSLATARAVILAIGFNDLARRDPPAIAQNARAILDLIPDRVPVLWSSVFPVDEEPRSLTGYEERIRHLNHLLADVVGARPGSRFLDTHALLADSTGTLPDALHCGDGIHLSEAGYALWIDALRKGLAALPARPGSDQVGQSLR